MAGTVSAAGTNSVLESLQGRLDPETTPPPEERPVEKAERASTERGVPEPKAKSNGDRNLEFDVDDTTGRIVIRVKDGLTGEVIREIPPEEAREALGSLVGVNVDEER